jgi:predicted aspartyl protease
MIRGQVNARREAMVPLRIRPGPGGPELDLDVLLDTGFTGALTLPASIVSALALTRQSAGRAILADGSVRPLDLYAAEILWDGTWRPVLASAVGDETLAGMRLLSGHSLRIDVLPGGTVEILKLP